MPPRDLDKLTRRQSYKGSERILVRPGIAMILYSQAELTSVMIAAAEVLQTYLDFVPHSAIAALYAQPPEDDLGGSFLPFDAAARRHLFDSLRAGSLSAGDAGYGCVLSATLDGQAGDYGFTLGAVNLESEDVDESETSFLRLQLPWNLLDKIDVEALVDFLATAAERFPFCCGNAGMSFIHTIAYEVEARREIQKLLPRFLGFDSAYDWAKLEMRGKSPPAHWLNFLNSDLLAALGGEARLRLELDGCTIKQLGSGLLIRAARFPPVVDVNRRGLDIGRLPVVARVLKPVIYNEAGFIGLPDEDSGQAWLDRFDDQAPLSWDNGQGTGGDGVSSPNSGR